MPWPRVVRPGAQPPSAVPAPDPGEPRRAPAGGAVVLVSQRVLHVIVLVVVLGRIERRRGADGRDDRPAEALLDLRLGGLGEPPLLGPADEDLGAIAVAAIAELPAGVERVDVAPEDVQQLRVTDARRVVAHLHDLRVAGPAGRHALVGRVRDLAARETGHHVQHAGRPLEGRLDTPEAAPGEDRARRLAGRGRQLAGRAADGRRGRLARDLGARHRPQRSHGQGDQQQGGDRPGLLHGRLHRAGGAVGLHPEDRIGAEFIAGFDHRRGAEFGARGRRRRPQRRRVDSR